MYYNNRQVNDKRLKYQKKTIIAQTHSLTHISNGLHDKFIIINRTAFKQTGRNVKEQSQVK